MANDLNDIAAFKAGFSVLTDNKNRIMFLRAAIKENTEKETEFLVAASNCMTEADARLLLKNIFNYETVLGEKTVDRLYYHLNKKVSTAATKEHRIENSLPPAYEGEPFAARLLRAAKKASATPEENEAFRDLLFSEGEKRVCDIHHIAMTYLINNFTQDNFDAVNTLASHYGLKIEFETRMAPVNERTVNRIQFEGGLSYAKKDNPFYEIQYSEAYRKFIPSPDTTWQEEDYKDQINQSDAVKTLREYGYVGLIDLLPKTFKGMHVPPELVPELNLKDISHLLIEYKIPTDKIANNNRFPMVYFTRETSGNDNLPPARDAWWQDISEDENMRHFLNRYQRRHGSPEDSIIKFWRNIKEYGLPSPWIDSKDSEEVKRILPIFIPMVHHYEALQHGGDNLPYNFVGVASFPKYICDGMNSHNILHEYDNPLINLWINNNVTSGDELWISTKQSELHNKPIRLRTIFIANEGKEENQVRFYGGPDTRLSMYTGNLPQNIRNIPEQSQKKLQTNNNTEKKQQTTLILNKIGHQPKNTKDKTNINTGRGRTVACQISYRKEYAEKR